MTARLKTWLPYLLLLIIALAMTAALQWSETVYCRRYLCFDRLEEMLNLLLPWLAAGLLAVGCWSWRRRPRGGLAAAGLIAGGCLALVSVVQISRYHELRSVDEVSLANALAQAARPPQNLEPDWDSPAILPIESYLLLPPETVISDYVTFRQTGERTIRGGLDLNVFERPDHALAVFRRLVEQLPPGRLLNEGQQPAGQQAYLFSRGQEQHLAFLRCRAVVYLWTAGVSNTELAAFAADLDQWLTEVTCDR